MNLADIVVICILIVIFALAGRSLYRRHKRLKENGGCCNGCAGCGCKMSCAQPQKASVPSRLPKQPKGKG